MVKAIGGGQKSESGFFPVWTYFVANFMYFHVLSTEFQNLDRLTQNLRICGGWVGSPKGVFLAIWGSSMTKESKKVLENVL